MVGDAKPFELPIGMHLAVRLLDGKPQVVFLRATNPSTSYGENPRGKIAAQDQCMTCDGDRPFGGFDHTVNRLSVLLPLGAFRPSPLLPLGWHAARGAHTASLSKVAYLFCAPIAIRSLLQWLADNLAYMSYFN